MPAAAELGSTGELPRRLLQKLTCPVAQQGVALARGDLNGGDAMTGEQMHWQTRVVLGRQATGQSLQQPMHGQTARLCLMGLDIEQICLHGNDRRCQRQQPGDRLIGIRRTGIIGKEIDESSTQ